MFYKKQNNRSTARTRQPSPTLNESFRRNNIVVSKRQKELALRQQSVTQRQVDKKRAQHVRQVKTRATDIVVLVVAVFLMVRMQASSVAIQSNASSSLSATQLATYQTSILKDYQQQTIAKQAWLLDKDALRAQVIQQFPEIEYVTFMSSAPFNNTLKANVRFRKAVFVWKDASNTTQFVDKNGVLFEKNLNPSVNTTKLTHIEDQSGTVLQAGSSVLTAQLVQFVGQLHDKVPAAYGKQTTISKVIIPRSTREVQVQVVGQPYSIKLSSQRGLEEQVGELSTLLGFLKSKNITPAQYIDLRIPHKAFYK